MNRSFLLLSLFLFACGAAPPAAPQTAEPFKPVATGPEEAKAPPAPAEDDSPVPIAPDDAVWGNRDAWVTIVEFSDFQCPFCSRVTTTLDALKEQYGPDDLRIVFKNEPLPFHVKARPAAEIGAGVLALAGNDAFWKFHDTVFRAQQRIDEEQLLEWGADAGADLAALTEGYRSKRWADKVDRDIALAKKLGVNGTPGFLINGTSLSGAQPIEKFKQVIDAELANAKAMVERGTPRNRVYVEATALNRQKAAAAAVPDDDDDDEKEDTKTVWKVPVGGAPVRGSAKALVTIVEFSDFQCPYCKRVEETLKTLRGKYGDKIRLVWKNEPLPFHPRAMPAANFALEVRAAKGDAGFWDAHDRLFDSQAKLEDADLDALAGAMGVPAARTQAAVKAQKYKRAIEEDMDLADDLQANGTPHFFINGRRLVGAQPVEKFEKIIDEEIKHAQDLLAKGTPQDKLYDALIKDGKGPPPLERKTVTPNAAAPSKGPANAKVVIQEFADFQCPFCARAEATIDEVLKAYPTQVRLVWRHLPLTYHPDAAIAAQAAQEALAQKGNDGFWKMHKLLFDGQKVQDGLKRDALEGYARTIGLDVARFNAALDAGKHKAEVDLDERAASAASLGGTPAFVINGYFISGAQPATKFRKVIERALADAAAPPAPAPKK
jgi:protein-disulfide isomerase